MHFFECSAKTGETVEKAFNSASKVIFDNIVSGEYDLSSEAIGIKPGNALPNHVFGNKGTGNQSLGAGGQIKKKDGGGCC